MAKVFLVGIQDMNFPTRDGKGVIDGIALQCNYPDLNVIGLRADSAEKFATLSVLRLLLFLLSYSITLSLRLILRARLWAFLWQRNNAMNVLQIIVVVLGVLCLGIVIVSVIVGRKR